jgi:hypothetical protein
MTAAGPSLPVAPPAVNPVLTARPRWCQLQATYSQQPLRPTHRNRQGLQPSNSLQPSPPHRATTTRSPAQLLRQLRVQQCRCCRRPLQARVRTHSQHHRRQHHHNRQQRRLATRARTRLLSRRRQYRRSRRLLLQLQQHTATAIHLPPWVRLLPRARIRSRSQSSCRGYGGLQHHSLCRCLCLLRSRTRKPRGSSPGGSCSELQATQQQTTQLVTAGATNPVEICLPSRQSG